MPAILTKIFIPHYNSNCFPYFYFSPSRTSADISSHSQQLQVLVKDPPLCTNDTSSALEILSDGGLYKLPFYLLTYLFTFANNEKQYFKHTETAVTKTQAMSNRRRMLETNQSWMWVHFLDPTRPTTKVTQPDPTQNYHETLDPTNTDPLLHNFQLPNIE